jgi:ABC-type Na+ efflux pump permease subunit
MTTRSSIFNLLLIGSIFISGVLALMRSAMRVDVMIKGPKASSVLIAHVVLLAFFLGYFPFTHMTHAYMKFFTWHGVRWNDSPAIHNTHAAGRLANNLQRKVGWAAPHLADDARATWADVVADNSRRGAAKRA